MNKERSTKYHYFYKITNLINGNFYYGVHNTNNLDDGYMGSGSRLKTAYKKYGIENFSKEILKFFDSLEDAFDYEADFVTEELVKDTNCYNQSTGGRYSWKSTKNTICVRDSDGNFFRVHKDDPRWVSGELVGATKGKIPVRDKDGSIIQVDHNDPRLISGEFEYWAKNMVSAKDKKGNIYYISRDDPRWVSGELVGATKGKKFSEEYKKKMSEIQKGHHRKHKMCYVCNENEVILIESVNKEEYIAKGYQSGKKFKKLKSEKMRKTYLERRWQDGNKNSQYGTCWIYNVECKKCKKIKLVELEKYISDGWIKGRKMKF